MSERIIDTAELSGIENALDTLNDRIVTVYNQVSEVNEGLTQTNDKLETLYEEFMAFVATDRLAKSLQEALTRRVEVRQELENTYGHYDTVRRHTTGILQAADAGVVRQETMRGATEQLMLDAPRYWLAPALVALAAWLADNRPLAERALGEALRRDNRKVSLFFALVARRGERYQASCKWLDHYLTQQDCRKLDRETVVLLNAVAHGVFGAEGRSLCVARMREWLEDLGAADGFVDKQRQQWQSAITLMAPKLGADEYPYLRKYCADWQKLEDALRGARLHAQAAAYFDQVFAGEIHLPPQVADEVDNLLAKLVNDFDDEELPLRQKEERLSLIIEENGDKAAAQKRFDLNKEALKETVDYTQLLTNAALNPEASGANHATQRMAIALAKEWIVSAHDTVTAHNRALAPLDVGLKIAEWAGKTRDGANEGELAADLARYWLALQVAAVAKVKITPGHWIVAGVGAMLLFAGWPFPAILGIGALGWVGYTYYTLDQRKQALVAQHKAALENDTKILRATLAEMVDWRKDYAKADAEAGKVRASLAAVTAEEHLQTRYESGRAVN